MIYASIFQIEAICWNKDSSTSSTDGSAPTRAAVSQAEVGGVAAFSSHLKPRFRPTSDCAGSPNGSG